MTTSLGRRTIYALEYAALRGATALLQSLPIEHAMAAADHIGDLASRLDPRHFRVADENLARVYPELDTPARQALARESFRNLMRTAVELATIPRQLSARRWRERIEFPRSEAVRDFVRDRPVILVTGHIGNWEVLGMTLGFLGIETTSIARRLENPYLDSYCLGLRQCRRQKIIYKDAAVRSMANLLRRGGKLGFVIDQNAGRRGIFCDFLGTLASTTPLPAILARRLGIPILPGFAIRTGRPFHFRIEAGEPIFPENYSDLEPSAAITAMTQAATDQLAACIRRAPQQWLWMHRRWKTRPPAELELVACANTNEAKTSRISTMATAIATLRRQALRPTVRQPLGAGL